MSTPRSWQAHPGYAGGGKVVLIVVLVLAIGGVAAGVLFASGAGPGSGGEELTRFLPMLIVPVVLAAVIIPLLAMRRRKGRILLEGGSLVFETAKGRREFALGDLELSLGKLYAGGTYVGSLCILHASRTGDSLRLLGAGVEFPPERYDAAEGQPYRFDFSLDGQSFRELVDELANHAPGIAPATAAPVRTGRSSIGGEQVFDAVPDTSKNVIKIVVLSFAAMMLVGLAGYGLQELLPDGGAPAGEQNLMIGLSILGIAVPALLIVWFLRRGKGGRIQVHFSDQAIVLAAGRTEKYRAEMPPASVSLRLWRTSSGHGGSYTQGPAVRIHNRQGKKLTLGVRDPGQARKGHKTVSMVDYVISADAGKAFLALLQRQGVLQSRLPPA